MTTPQITFAPAVRHAAKLKAAIDGPSGSGKTEGALALATAIVAQLGGKIALADTEPLGTEAGAASLYADRFTFDTILVPQAVPAILEQVVDAAIAQRYTVLIVDTVSHAWGNVMDRKDQHEANNPSANRFALWGKYGPEWDRLVRKLVTANIHVIVTMRSKQAYTQIGEGRGAKIEKLGMAPQVREGSEYDFSLVFSVNMQHRALVTKGRAVPWSNEEYLDLRSADVQQALLRWMNTGGTLPAPTPVAGAPASAVPDPYAGYDPATIDLRSALNLPLYGAASFAGGFGGQPLHAVPSEQLDPALAKYEALLAKNGLKPRQAEILALMQAAIWLVRADREARADGEIFDEIAAPAPAAPEGEQRPDPTPPAPASPAGLAETSDGKETPSTSRPSRKRAAALDAPDPTPVGTILAQTRHLLDHQSFPLPALPYFEQEIRELRDAAPAAASVRAKRAFALAGLVLKIGEKLDDPRTARQAPLIYTLLQRRETFTTDALQGILVQLDDLILEGAPA